MSELSLRPEEGYIYENLHEIGTIQNQGYVVGVKIESARVIKIVSISDNLISASWMTHKDPKRILNNSIYDVFDINTALNIANLLQKFQFIGMEDPSANHANAKNFTLLRMMCKGATFSVKESMLCCSVAGCSTKDTFILEIEEISEPAFSLPNSQILQSGDIVSLIRASDSIESVTGTFCDAVMDIMTGYDRGMVYHFADDFSGQVIYERIRDTSKVTSTYLHHHFPASDIPPQARELYLKNGLRFIFDVNGSESKIISCEAGTLDLTISCLRACSKCHLQYLRNMGIVSSMSIAIVINHTLWGLYSLHSYDKPVKPTVEQRIMLEMVASISAMRVDSFLREGGTKRKLEFNRLISNLETMNSIHEFLRIFEKEILAITDSHALIIYGGSDDKERVVYGDASIIPTPDGYDILSKRCKLNSLYSLAKFEEGLSGQGAGVIFFKNHYTTIALVRRSLVSDIKWAGKPDSAHDPNIPVRLQPRSSFELYVEEAHKSSKAWTPIDIEIAEYFFDRISQYLHSEMLATFRLSLDQSNAECLNAIESAKQNNEFFAHMSHELRTPFHGVMSSLQILSSAGSKMPESERQEIVECALECGKSMLRTLDDILTIAKSKNCVDVVTNPINIYKIILSTARIMSPIADNKSVHFTNETRRLCVHNQNISNDEWKSFMALGDETRIGQIANNLTNNAIKFTPTGGSVTLRVSLVPQNEVLYHLDKLSNQFSHKYVATEPQILRNEKIGNDVCWFILEVEDTGCGVKDDDMKVMFNAYQQLSSGVSKTYQGTGLGLHIVRIHVDIMSGMLAVASAVGKGTVFFVAIPLKLMDKPTRKEVTGELSARHEDAMNVVLTTAPVKKDCTFMIVDDSQVNLRLTQRKIRMACGDDTNFKLAYDGLEAIEIYKNMIENGTQTQLTGIFMDYHMPKCSGLEAIVEIRHIEAEYKIKPVYIVAFTADLSEGSGRLLMNGGANEVLPKPTPNNMLEQICFRLARSN